MAILDSRFSLCSWAGLGVVRGEILVSKRDVVLPVVHVRSVARVLVAGIVAVAPILSSPSQAANVLEKAIEAAQPCRSLKTRVSPIGFNVDVGIDKFDAVRIDSLQILVNRDAAEANARGMLACKTSDEAVVTGGFSATVEVQVQADLATCKIGQSAFNIVETHGLFGDLVSGFEGQISKVMRQSVENALKKLCEN